MGRSINNTAFAFLDQEFCGTGWGRKWQGWVHSREKPQMLLYFNSKFYLSPEQMFSADLQKTHQQVPTINTLIQFFSALNILLHSLHFLKPCLSWKSKVREHLSPKAFSDHHHQNACLSPLHTQAYTFVIFLWCGHQHQSKIISSYTSFSSHQL